MNLYTKVAQSAIRLVAFGLVLTTFFLCADDLYLFLSKQLRPRPVVLALKSVPGLLGLGLALKSRSWAAQWTKDLD